MEMPLIIAGAILVIVGIIRHSRPGGFLPRLGLTLKNIPGSVIVGLGAIMIIAGYLLK